MTAAAPKFPGRSRGGPCAARGRIERGNNEPVRIRRRDVPAAEAHEWSPFSADSTSPCENAGWRPVFPNPGWSRQEFGPASATLLYHPHARIAALEGLEAFWPEGQRACRRFHRETECPRCTARTCRCDGALLR